MTDLTQAYRLLDPLEPLAPDSEYYVERPGNPMDRIRVDLELSNQPRHFLITGHRGTGKTTELWRLANALEGDREVVKIDLGRFAELATTNPGHLFSEALQGEASRRLFKSADDAFTLFRHLNRPDRPAVMIFDGLERFLNDDGTIAAFTHNPVHAWPVSVVCTIPLSIYLSEAAEKLVRQFDRSAFLPGIAVFNQSGEVTAEGMRTASSIIRRRVGESVFMRSALEVLAYYSAGIHRELLQLAQRACVIAALEGAGCISEHHASAAVAEQRNEYSVVLRTPDFSLLEAVRGTKQLPGGSGVSRLIRNQLIVAYANGTTWFDVHPILWELIEPRSHVA